MDFARNNCLLHDRISADGNLVHQPAVTIIIGVLAFETITDKEGISFRLVIILGTSEAGIATPPNRRRSVNLHRNTFFDS